MLIPLAATIHRRAPPPVLLAADPEKVYRRAEFWAPDSCTLLELANVLGRWESSSEWSERTEFALAQARRDEDMAQGATKERYDYAQRNGLVERVALQQNVPKLPFTNAPLAAALGRSVADFEEMPVRPAAVDVLFDALVQSKSSLIASEVCDKRRAALLTSDGAVDEGALAAGLYKSRALVIFSWVFFGKGRLYGFAAVGKVVIDSLGLFEKLPPEIAPYADWIYIFAALALAVQATRSQAAVAVSTSDYETVSAEEAEASAELAKGDEAKYSTVFEKWAAKSQREATASAAEGSDGAALDPSKITSEPWFFPLCFVLFGILGRSILAGS